MNTHSASGDASREAQRSGRTSVLVVEDEKHIRLMLRTVLEVEGFAVEEAEDGRDAVNRVRGGAFDVMVLDLNMPNLDGMGALKELKEQPPAMMPRVVVLTAYGSTSAAVRATRLGALDFLEKPASPQELRESVAAVLREPQPAAEHPADGDTEGGYEAVIAGVRAALRASNVSCAESLLMQAADLSHHDAAYFNLVGVIYEMRRQWRLAKKFYGMAIRTDRKYEPAQHNMRRMYELFTFGRAREAVALGDPAAGAWAALEEFKRELHTR